jgi:hypothetical protein
MRRILLAITFALTLAPAPASASWNGDGVTIIATNATIPIVKGCSDGDRGTFVAWQEGTLHLQHLLESGDIDPTWPASGVTACSRAIDRPMLGLVPDQLGGVYLWWKEGTGLFLHRITASGQPAAGWPVNGLQLGTVFSFTPLPTVRSDGEHGVYAIWSQVVTGSDGVTVRAAHLGPNGGATGAWPTVFREIAPPTPSLTVELWPQISVGPGGVTYVAWATWPGSRRLLRLAPDGTPAPGWQPEGVDFGPIPFSDIPFAPLPALIGLCADDRGGAFFQVGDFDSFGLPTSRFYRWGKDGQCAPDWPATGIPVPVFFPGSYVEALNSRWVLDGSFSVTSDGHDGAFLAVPDFSSEGPALITYLSCTPAGQVSGVSGWTAASIGHDFLPNPAGGGWLADYFSFAHCSQFQGPAYLRMRPGWYEEHCQTAFWYSAVGLAPTATGGVILLWAQTNERRGLFARRFEAGGQVSVGSEEFERGLRIRFAPGIGVRGAVNFESGSIGRFDLFDLAGRRLAMCEVRSGVEFTLRGTETIPSGLYFVRATAGTEVFRGKVLVTR